MQKHNEMGTKLRAKIKLKATKIKTWLFLKKINVIEISNKKSKKN